MISADDIVSLVTAGISDANVTLEDLTGGQAHWKAPIISDAFEGLSRVKQHQLVYGTLAEPLKGPLHALQLQTLTYAQAKEAGLMET